LKPSSDAQQKMRKQGILIVDRDPTVCAALGKYLRGVGFSVLEASTWDEALALVSRETPSLIILDLQLDGYDAFMAISEIRLVTDAPIIVTAAEYDEIDKISSLEGGADDYLQKSCKTRVLLAHVRARLRRRNSQKDAMNFSDSDRESAPNVGRPMAAFHAFEFDVFIYPGLGYELRTVGGDQISLSARELSFLRLLAENAQRHVPFEEIAVRIYQGQERVEHRISVMVSRLRNKLEPYTSSHPIIVCKPNIGYRLNAAVKNAA
jgi:two-component system, OmpR family, response regulator